MPSINVSAWVFLAEFRKVCASLMDKLTNPIYNNLSRLFYVGHEIAETSGYYHWNKWKCQYPPIQHWQSCLFSVSLYVFLPCCLAVTQYERSKDRCSHFYFKIHPWVWLENYLKKNTCRQQRIFLGLWVVKEQESTISNTKTLFTVYQSF